MLAIVSLTGINGLWCFSGAPWSTQAVVEWMTSVQLELLRSGRSKRLTQQLSTEAIDKVSLHGSQDDAVNSSDGNGRVPAELTGQR